MTKLNDLQDSFQKAILNGEKNVLEHICDSNKEKKGVLLGVYCNAYVARLIEFLMGDYEKLHMYLGDEQFFQVAREYIAANPSHNPNGRWFGSKMPEFLANNESYSDIPQVVDLALFECALNDAFDAPDAEILTLNDLAALDVEEWPKLTFRFHPSTRRLNFKTNAADIWSALQDDAIPESKNLEEPDQLLIYREGRTPKFRHLSYAEAMMWDEAAKGATFSALCEMLAIYSNEEEAPVQAAVFLQGWIATGIISAFELA